MLRLLLMLVVGIAVLCGTLYLMNRQAQVTAGPTTPGSGPPQVRAVRRDWQEIEARNRAALDATIKKADESR